jgi:hypothetical protein
MAPNFIECGREQAFVMPPSLRDWVPGEHLVWTMLEAVEEMELSDFYADCRDDGHGRPAYDPKMMVALLLYAYARETAPRAGSSGRVGRTWPIGELLQPPARSLQRSPSFGYATSGRWPISSARCWGS